MSLKTLKDEFANTFVVECQKIAPELGKPELFWCAIACAFVGWLIMGLNTGATSIGFWTYGLLMLGAGFVGCLLMYQKPEK